MKLTRRIVVAAAVAVWVGGWCLSARADLLSYSTYAYTGSGSEAGPKPGGAWYGVATYSDLTLTGSVEWEVFLPSTFNSLFSASGYTANTSELVYAFQVENTGTSDLSTIEANVIDPHPFDTVSWFNIPGETDMSTPASSHNIAGVLDYAKWFFSPGIPMGDSSVGLAYSSPNAPIYDSNGSVTNSALGDDPSLLPEPSTSLATLPEPGTAALLGFAGVLLCFGGGVSRRAAGILTSLRC